MNIEEWMKLILGSSGALVVLILGIKWLDRDRAKVLKGLQEERDGRIKLLEDHAKTCNEDRVADRIQAAADRVTFQNQVNTLTAEIINIYKTRAQQTMLNQETENVKARKEMETIPAAPSPMPP